MLRKILIAPILAALLAAAGCGSTADSAIQLSNEELTQAQSPYRFVKISDSGGVSRFQKQLIGVATKSLADEQLTRDILRNIGSIEKPQGGSENPKLVEVRTIDGAPHPEYEIWVIERGSDTKAYTVKLIPVPDGTVDVNIKGPW